VFERPSGPLAQSYLPKCYRNTLREGGDVRHCKRNEAAVRAEPDVDDAVAESGTECYKNSMREGRVAARDRWRNLRASTRWRCRLVGIAVQSVT
jgi:hypothetical protein